MPHQTDVLVQGVNLFQNFAVVLEKSKALNGIRMLDFRTGKWHSMSFPEPVYSAFPAGNPEYDTHLFRYSYTSLITPASVFDYDMETHKATLLKQQEVLGGYDPNAVCFRARLGHRPRRNQSAVVYRVQERFPSQWRRAAVPVRLRILWHRHARDILQPAA